MDKLLEEGRKMKHAPSEAEVKRFFKKVRQRGMTSLAHIDLFQGIRKMFNNEEFMKLQQTWLKYVDYCLIDESSNTYSVLFKQASDLALELVTRSYKKHNCHSPFALCIGLIAMISFLASFITSSRDSSPKIKRRRRLHKASDRFIYRERFYCVCRTKSAEVTDSMIECTDCKEWFHYRCIGLDGDSMRDFNERPILFDFHCGVTSCSNFGEFKLIVKENSSTVWSCQLNCIPFNGVEFKMEERKEAEKTSRLVSSESRSTSRKTKGLEIRNELDDSVRCKKKPAICFVPDPNNVEEPSKNGVVDEQVASGSTNDKERHMSTLCALGNEMLETVEGHNNNDIMHVTIKQEVQTEKIFTPSDTIPTVSSLENVSVCITDNILTSEKSILEEHNNTVHISPIKQEVQTENIFTPSDTIQTVSSLENVSVCITDNILTSEKSILEEHNYVDSDEYRVKNYPGASIDEAVEKELRSTSSALYKNNDVELDKLDDEIIQLNDLEKLLGAEIPTDSVFKRTIEGGSFKIDEKEWGHCVNTISKGNSWFPSGKESGKVWQDIFILGMKRFNPYCSFCFYRNYVSNPIKRARKDNAPLFKATGYCNHGKKDKKGIGSCPVEFTLVMSSLPTATITFTGEVRHHICSTGARPIRGVARQKLREQFQHGEKPFKTFVTASSDYDKNVLMAGNCDGVGRNPLVLRKIASESRQGNRLDKDLSCSLEKIKADMIGKHASNSNMPGFVQDIGSDPFFIHFYSRDSILLWANLAKEHVASMDATGKVVRPNIINGKKLLYYEISIPNPTKGGSTIPIAGVLTENQSQPMILHFLRRFQHAEKCVKHKNVQPVMFNTDWGLAILLSLMTNYNGEDMPTYIDRCWKIVSGKGSERDMQKTVFHICLSHHMKLMKKLCLNYFKQDFTYGMYVISLLLNAYTLNEFEEIWQDITFILLSENLTEKVIQCSNVIKEKINRLNASRKEIYSEYLHAGPEEVDKIETGDKSYKEEERDVLSKNSKFKARAREILNFVEKEVALDQSKCSVKAQKNGRYSVQFIHNFMNKYMQTYPLWSNIMLGDLKRHSTSYASYSTLMSKVKVTGEYRSVLDPIRTTSCQEQSFSVLKHNFLRDQSNYRVDDFVGILACMYFSVQLKSSRTILMLKGRLKCSQDSLSSMDTVSERSVGQKPTSDRLQLQDSLSNRDRVSERSVGQKPTSDRLQLREQWNKPGKIPISGLPNKIGVFQQKPSKLLQAIRTKNTDRTSKDYDIFEAKNHYCGMPNIGNTCWFNALMQGLCPTTYVTNLFVRRANCLIDIESDIRVMYQLQESLIKVWTHMRYNCPIEVPKNRIECILRTGRLTDAEFQKGEQCDPFEFLQTNGKEFSDIWVNYSYEYKCSKCTFSSTHLNKERTLHLPIPDKECTVGDLLITDKEAENIEKTCEHCGHMSAESKTVIKDTSDVLVILLKRYDNSLQKKYTEVTPDLNLQVEENMYRLKSVLCHYGNQLNSGHYITYIVHDCMEGTVLVKCDDTNLEKLDLNWPKSVKDGNYMLFYEKTDVTKVPAVELSNVCLGLSETAGFKKAWVTVTSEKGLTLLDIEPQRKLLKAIAIGDTRKVLGSIECIDSKVEQIGALVEQFGKFLTKGREIPYQLSNTYFWVRIIMYFVYKCPCGHISGEFANGTNLSISHNKLFGENDVNWGFRDLLTAELGIKNCTCKDLDVAEVSKGFVVALPSTLVVTQQNPKKITRRIDLTSLVQKTYCCVSKIIYELECVFVRTKDSLIIFKPKGGQYVRVNGKNAFAVSSNFVMSTISTNGDVVLLYNKTVHTERMTLSSLNNKVQEPIVLDNDVLHVEKELSLGPIRVSLKNITMMLSHNWYGLDELDMYMKCLSMHECCRNESTLFVPSAWLANTFFKDGKVTPTFFTAKILQNKSKWFQYNRVVIPGNVGDHWVAFVIDFNLKVITFCNSLKENHLNLLSQVINLLSALNVYQYGEQMSKSAFRICYLNEQVDFPFQNDKYSCGPYVCLMVKAVLLKAKFIFHHRRGRNSIVNDIINCALGSPQ
jgi:hypothetical protein